MGVKNPCLLTNSLLIILIFFLPSGCAQFNGGWDDISPGAADSEKLHQVEVLELKKAGPEENPGTEMAIPAPAKLALSLEECRAMVIENNLDLKVQLIEPAIAVERVGVEEAKFEATFSAGINYFKNNTPVASTLDIEGSEIEGLGARLGVTIPLRSGGEVNVNLADNAIETDSTFAIYNPTYETDLSASISQPLLRGAGRRASEYGIWIAKFDKKITDAQTKLQVIYALAEADKAYWRLYAARELLEVRQQQYELARVLNDETEAFVDVGSKARIEVVRTRARMAEKLEAIIIAENNARDRERDLKLRLHNCLLYTSPSPRDLGSNLV